MSDFRDSLIAGAVSGSVLLALLQVEFSVGWPGLGLAGIFVLAMVLLLSVVGITPISVLAVWICGVGSMLAVLIQIDGSPWPAVGASLLFGSLIVGAWLVGMAGIRALLRQLRVG